MRKCGSCSACCTALLIAGIPGYEGDKPAGEPCRHLRAAGGCSIHSSRPTVCRDFYCAWMLGIGEPEERPDRLGVLTWDSETNSEQHETRPFSSLEIIPGAFLRLQVGLFYEELRSSYGRSVFKIKPDGSGVLRLA